MDETILGLQVGQRVTIESRGLRNLRRTVTVTSEPWITANKTVRVYVSSGATRRTTEGGSLSFYPNDWDLQYQPTLSQQTMRVDKLTVEPMATPSPKAPSARKPTPKTPTSRKPSPDLGPSDRWMFVYQPDALSRLEKIEGKAWAERQRRGGVAMDNGFLLNLAAYRAIEEQGLLDLGVPLADLDPAAGAIFGEGGTLYAVMPDGEVVMIASTAPADKQRTAERLMRVL
ncbi:MAG: hypothetical protein WC713_13585, partial [Candidatus Methylomirabilota bacterium]